MRNARARKQGKMPRFGEGFAIPNYLPILLAGQRVNIDSVPIVRTENESHR